MHIKERQRNDARQLNLRTHHKTPNASGPRNKTHEYISPSTPIISWWNWRIHALFWPMHTCVPLECMVCNVWCGIRGRWHANDLRIYPRRHSIPLGVFLWGCAGTMSNFCPRILHIKRISRRRNGRSDCYCRNRYLLQGWSGTRIFVCSISV